jgi:hypothetical protein
MLVVSPWNILKFPLPAVTMISRARSDPLRLLDCTPGAGGVTGYFLELIKLSFTSSVDLSGEELVRTGPASLFFLELI